MIFPYRKIKTGYNKKNTLKIPFNRDINKIMILQAIKFSTSRTISKKNKFIIDTQIYPLFRTFLPTCFHPAFVCLLSKF